MSNNYPRYFRRDGIVRAIQYFVDGPAIQEVSQSKSVNNGEPYVSTPRGLLRVFPGDWIIISEHTVQVCPPEHFDTVFCPVCPSTTDKKR